jgi:hypothetical protein
MGIGLCTTLLGPPAARPLAQHPARAGPAPSGPCPRGHSGEHKAIAPKGPKLRQKPNRLVRGGALANRRGQGGAHRLREGESLEGRKRERGGSKREGGRRIKGDARRRRELTGCPLLARLSRARILGIGAQLGLTKLGPAGRQQGMHQIRRVHSGRLPGPRAHSRPARRHGDAAR